MWVGAEQLSSDQRSGQGQVVCKAGRSRHLLHGVDAGKGTPQDVVAGSHQS